MRPLAAAVVSCLLAVPVFAAPARVPAADGSAGGAAGRSAFAPYAAGLSLDQAVDLVQKRYDAKVVRAEESREGDHVVYRIRLLSADGRVFTVRVDARTGRID
jgi:hypothetical protein